MNLNVPEVYIGVITKIAKLIQEIIYNYINIILYSRVEPCADFMVSAAARRSIFVDGAHKLPG